MSHYLRLRIFFTGVLLFSFLFMGIEAPAQGITRFTRTNSGLIDNFVNQVADFNGVLAVCTQNGVTLIHADRFENWKRGENGFPDASVQAATVFGGRLWVGTQGRGVARLDDGRWKVFSKADSSLLDDFVTALQPLGNRLFIGAREGLCTFDGLLCEPVRFPGNAAPRVTCLARDGGGILAGTGAGRPGAGNGFPRPGSLHFFPFPTEFSARQPAGWCMPGPTGGRWMSLSETPARGGFSRSPPLQRAAVPSGLGWGVAGSFA